MHLPYQLLYFSIDRFLSLFPQHIVSVLSCSSGSTLPLHLAAYIYPCAPALHVRYCLHSYPLHSGPPLQLSAPTQRAAHRRGKIQFLKHQSVSPGNVITPPLLFPQVLVVDLGNSRFLRQVQTTPSFSMSNPVTPLLVLWLCQMLRKCNSLQRAECVYLCVSSATAGWWGLHSSTQAAGGSRTCAWQEERAGLWERRSTQWWLSMLFFSLGFIHLNHVLMFY